MHSCIRGSMPCCMTASLIDGGTLHAAEKLRAARSRTASAGSGLLDVDRKLHTARGTEVETAAAGEIVLGHGDGAPGRGDVPFRPVQILGTDDRHRRRDPAIGG